MADKSLNRNKINPQEATHSIFFHGTNIAETTLFSHFNPNNINNDEFSSNTHRTNDFQDNHNFEDNVGKRQTVTLNNKHNNLKHRDQGNSIYRGKIKLSNQDIAFSQTNTNHERTKSSFDNPSLPNRNSIHKDIIESASGKQVTVKHTINIIKPTFVKGNKKKTETYNNNVLPSAESTQPERGNGNINYNHNRETFNLDYVDVEYVNQESKVELVSPSSNLLTHMHQIRPTYIPRSTTTTSTKKTIFNPLLDPNFKPISSSGGKRWSVKKRGNNNDKSQNGNSKNSVLKASTFPDLPSLDIEKNRAGGLYHINLFLIVGSSVVLCAISFQF